MHNLDTRTGKGISWFDIDETLATTSAKVMVIDKDTKQVIKTLHNTEFNTYKLNENEAYDFEQFRDGELFLKTSKPIVETITVLKRILSKKRANSVCKILTARGNFNNREKVIEWFELHGLPMHDIELITCGDYATQNKMPIDEVKAKIILEKSAGCDTIRLFEDSTRNLEAFFKLKDKLPQGTTLYGTLIKHGVIADETKIVCESIEYITEGTAQGNTATSIGDFIKLLIEKYKVSIDTEDLSKFLKLGKVLNKFIKEHNITLKAKGITGAEGLWSSADKLVTVNTHGIANKSLKAIMKTLVHEIAHAAYSEEIKNEWPKKDTDFKKSLIDNYEEVAVEYLANQVCLAYDIYSEGSKEFNESKYRRMIYIIDIIEKHDKKKYVPTKYTEEITTMLEETIAKRELPILKSIFEVYGLK